MCVAVGGGVGVGEGVCVAVGGGVGVGEGVCVAVGGGMGVGDGVCVAVGGGVGVLVAAASTGAAVAAGSTSGESSPQAASATSAAAVTAMPPIIRNTDLPPLLERYPCHSTKCSTPRLPPDCAPRSMRARPTTTGTNRSRTGLNPARRDATTTTAGEARVRRHRAPKSALWRRHAPVCPSRRA